MKSKLSIDKYGTKIWKLPNGKFHREDGPAIEYIHGNKEWWLNSLRHREDGPAIEWSDDEKSWFLNGKLYSEQEYKIETRSMKLNKLLK